MLIECSKKIDVINLDTEYITPFISEDDVTQTMPRALDALRSLRKRVGRGAKMLGWLDLPRTPVREIEAITDAAKRIQDENDCLVVIGIGGSYVGIRAVIEALPEEAPFPVLFAGNSLSPAYHNRLLSALEGKRFAICVISKSGTTTEPAIAFRIFRQKLVERFGKDDLAKRIIAITDPKDGALRKVAEREGFKSFPIPPDVGGRYSVLSPVGLFPCAVAGIPIGEMLEGAAASMGRFTKDDATNEAIRYALIRFLLHERGTIVEVLSTFHPELASFCEWWKQLAGESEGKDGKGLYPASTVMTTDLHSLGQYLQEGKRELLETFLVASQPRSDLTVPHDEEDLDNLNYLAGKPMSEVNRKASEGTAAAHAAGGLPVMSVEGPVITPLTIGNLFIFFEIGVAVTGRLLGINPFNQPGVEEYKTRMLRLLGKPGVKRSRRRY